MRKVIVVEFITLDGVMQAPGGSKEDTAEGFKYGGWMGPYFDEVGGKDEFPTVNLERRIAKEGMLYMLL